MKQILKPVVTIVLLLLAIPALAGLAGCLAENDIMSYGAFRETALDSGWIAGVRAKIRKDFEPLNDVSGVPTDVTDAFLEEKLTDEICTIFWAGPDADFPAAELQEDLAERIRQCAVKMRTSGEIFVTDEEWTEMNENFPATAKYFIDTMRADVNLRGMGAYAESLTDQWQKLFPILVSGCAVLALGGVLVLCLIYRKKAFFPLYAAFFGAGLVLLAPAFWLKAADLAGRLQVEPSYLKNFLILLYDMGAGRLLTAGVILGAVGLVCGVAAFLFGKKEKAPVKPDEEEETYDTKLLG